jgi:CO dehydrogenase maturation factor
MKIAVSGKGGTGKTTICALIINYLLKKGKTPVLAVDADANATLAESLGVEVHKSVGKVLDDFLKQKEGLPFGLVKESLIENKLHEILVEEKGFDLLVMGQGEGPGCYCYPNAVLRDAIDKLSQNYKYVIIDNQAGLEHLSRRTNGDLDLLLLISDPTLRGIKTAGRLQNLVKSLNLKVGQFYLIINRLSGELPVEIFEEVKKQNLDLLEIISDDENIKSNDIQGIPLIALNDRSSSFRKIEDLMEKLKKD